MFHLQELLVFSCSSPRREKRRLHGETLTDSVTRGGIMGLFDFVKDIGKKIFDRDDEAAAKIKTEIESSNPGLSGLNVNYDPASGKVALSGNATSAEAMQKAVLIAGNVKGVAEVDA